MSEPIASPEVLELEGQVALGIEVERFLEGPIGRHIVVRAESERAEALEALYQSDPENAPAVRAAQNRVAVVDMIQQWLAEAIIAAHAANSRLDQLDQED